MVTRSPQKSVATSACRPFASARTSRTLTISLSSKTVREGMLSSNHSCPDSTQADPFRNKPHPLLDRQTLAIGAAGGSRRCPLRRASGARACELAGTTEGGVDCAPVEDGAREAQRTHVIEGVGERDRAAG